jgi:hypothetical protein
MHELAASLERAQAAILHTDASQLSAQTKRQQELCEELRRLAPESVPGKAFPLAEAVRSFARKPDIAVLHPAIQRRQVLAVELAQVEAQVANLNRAYGSLLRRARRTVDIFCRVLANSGVTYLPPATQTSSPTRIQEDKSCPAFLGPCRLPLAR